MRYFQPLGLALLLLCTIACSASLAIDKGICGTWKTTLHTPRGDIEITWKIDPSGSYTVSSRGASGSMSENGRISTDGNRYMKTTNIGPDNGTFTVMSGNQFSTTGRFGYTEWNRVGGGPSIASGSSSRYTPANAYGQSGGGYKPGSYNSGSGSYNSGGGSYKGSYVEGQQYKQTNGYDPSMNPRSEQWAKMGFGTAGNTKDQSGWKPRNESAIRSANLDSADLKTLLFSNFPIRGGGDEVEQFGLPALGRAAAGGMRKRDFRSIQ